MSKPTRTTGRDDERERTIPRSACFENGEGPHANLARPNLPFWDLYR